VDLGEAGLISTPQPLLVPSSIGDERQEVYLKINLNLKEYVWRADYGKPMRTGHKQGEMQITCFSEIDTAPEAEQLFLLSCFGSEKQESRFLL
jgi:hypothetical protein